MARHLVSTYDANLIFVGTSAEVADIDRLRGKLEVPSISLAGRTTIPVLAAVLSLCDFAFTLDTGNMHIARSVGLPMIILAPSWAPMVEWLPLGFNQYRIFTGNDISPDSAVYQVLDVPSRNVIEAFDELWAQYPVSEINRKERVQRSLSSTRAT